MRIRYIIFLLLLMQSVFAADSFVLTSSAFKNNDRIPELFTCNGDNVPPPLAWVNAPNQTQSFAIILLTPDSPMGKIYLWILYNIPARINALGSDLVKIHHDSMTGINSLFEASYRGPCPPDDRVHRYQFTIYALDTDTLDLSADADVDTIVGEIKEHTIQKAQLVGIFSH